MGANGVSILAMTALYIGLLQGNKRKAKGLVSEHSVTVEGQPDFKYQL